MKKLKLLFLVLCISPERISSGEEFVPSGERYEYNEKGQIESIFQCDGIVIICRYNEKDLLEEVCSSDGNLHYSYDYDEEGNTYSVTDHTTGNMLYQSPDLFSGKPEPIFSGKEESPSSAGFGYRLKHGIVSFIKSLASALHSLQNYFSIEGEVKKGITYIAENTVGTSYLNMIGCCGDPAGRGIYGEGELCDNLRITFVNGILNGKADLLESVAMISRSHGGVNVHYIFRPTAGWSHDLLQSMSIKSGYVSEQAKLLAILWKNLIAEMHGDGRKGGTVIHYAHSLGAADTYAAKELLTPEEQSAIRVVTFGSPTMIPNEGFLSVTNYVSVRDGIPLLDPFRRMESFIRGDEHIVCVGSAFGVPFVEHLFDSHSYRTVVEMLGREFLDRLSVLPFKPD